jgi:hypothetical protein
MGKIAREVAEAEIKVWLDYANVKDRARETYKEQVETLIDCVCDGTLTLNHETKILTQILNTPVGKDGSERTLDFKPRLRVGALQNHMRGVKAGDGDGRILAHVCALTSKNSELIKDMETHDYNTSSAIVIFFL